MAKDENKIFELADKLGIARANLEFGLKKDEKGTIAAIEKASAFLKKGGI